MIFTTETKQTIANQLAEFLAESGMKQSKFAELSGVRKEYINTILNGKFHINTGKGKATEIAEQYFEQILSYLNSDSNIVRNQNYLAMCQLFAYCKEHKKLRIIDGATGSGKSFTSEAFQKRNPVGTYLVKCADDFSSKEFMEEMAIAVGATAVGTRSKIRKGIVEKLSKESEALVIIDEAENLKENVYGSIKAITDKLQGKVSIVLIGANKDGHSSYYRWLENKASKLKGCFPQVFSRFKTEPVMLERMQMQDVIDMLTVNGLETSLAKQVMAVSDNMRDASEYIKQLSVNSQEG